MTKTKLNINGLSIPEKLARGRQIVTALTGNANFPSTQPTLAAVMTAINDLDAAYAATQRARQEAKTRTSEQNQKEDAFNQTLSKLAAHVESVSGDDEEKIMSAGMDVKAQTRTSREVTTPEGLAATASDHEGEIDLQWDRVDGARTYMIERSADPPTPESWQHETASTRSSTTIRGLTSGTKYWFRVASVGAQGQSGWSNPAVRIAP
jgi:Fibronectin type III domain